LGTHIFFSNGFAKGDIKAGTGILINKAFIPLSSIRKVFAPPSHLQGRITAIHTRTDSYDLFFASIYFRTPPDNPRAARFANEVTAWLDGVLSDLPARTIPILGFDLNDSSSGIVFGPYSTRRPRANAIAISEFFGRHGLEATSSFWKHAPTFYSQTSTSYIDFIATTSERRGHIQRVFVDHHSGDRLQLIAPPRAIGYQHCQT
jgi:hypothetical protein